MDIKKAGLGAALLVVGTVLIFTVVSMNTLVGNALAALSTLTLAAGALLFGTSEEGRAV